MGLSRIIHTADSETDDPLLVEAAGLRGHARFELAVRAYAAGLVRWREGTRLMHKLSAHKERMHVVGYLLHLSAADRQAGGDGGVAYGALHELCVARRGEVGPRVLKTMLALMTLAGFVDSWRGLADRRVKYYRPTARMLDHARLAYGYAAEALDAIDPAPNRAKRLKSDDRFLNRMLVTAGRDHAEAPPSERMPEFIGYIGGREGAGSVLAALMLAEIDGAPLPSRAALAARFGLSKTQVSLVIGEGVRQGYLEVDAAGQPASTPHLAETYRRWISIELAFHARHMRADEGIPA